MYSEHLAIEMSVGLRHFNSFVIFVHLRQAEAFLVQLGTHGMPPEREVLFKSSAQVGAVRCRLGHQLGEVLVAAGP